MINWVRKIPLYLLLKYSGFKAIIIGDKILFEDKKAKYCLVFNRMAHYIDSYQIQVNDTVIMMPCIMQKLTVLTKYLILIECITIIRHEQK